MHIHKMFKRMQKKHGGPPPPMFHGMHGMWNHMMPKSPGMWHHMMPKPHEMWPHMHHKMHPPMFHKMHHKMHKKHHHKKHHGRSSSSSSSSSESEDESLADGIDKVQIEDEQQGKENPGNETAPPPFDGGDMCKERFKCKKCKHFKSKESHKKEMCKSCFKKMHKNSFRPYSMQFSSIRGPSCRDSRYNKGIFHLPPPETSPDTEEGRPETEQNVPEEATPQVQFEEVTGYEKSRIAGQRSLRRGQRRGDSVDYFMQSIAEQIKKLPEAKIAEAKLKILEVVNEMQLDNAPEQNTPIEDMNIENQQQQEPQQVQSVLV